MAAFLTERFPDWISFGSSGGPSYRTTVIELLSGHEQRQKEWAYARHVYNVSFGARRVEGMSELLRFYQATSGRLKGFRYKDWLDYSSQSFPDPDTPITGAEQAQTLKDGNDYQLIKNYTAGGETQTRLITRIVPGTLLVEVGGVPTVPSAINNNQGTFTVAGTPVTAGYEFDVPVRFETDFLDATFESHDNLDSNIKVVEIREGPYITLP